MPIDPLNLPICRSVFFRQQRSFFVAEASMVSSSGIAAQFCTNGRPPQAHDGSRFFGSSADAALAQMRTVALVAPRLLDRFDGGERQQSPTT